MQVSSRRRHESAVQAEDEADASRRRTSPSGGDESSVQAEVSASVTASTNQLVSAPYGTSRPSETPWLEGFAGGRHADARDAGRGDGDDRRAPRRIPTRATARTEAVAPRRAPPLPPPPPTAATTRRFAAARGAPIARRSERDGRRTRRLLAASIRRTSAGGRRRSRLGVGERDAALDE